jgi:hypothetical protein
MTASTFAQSSDAQQKDQKKEEQDAATYDKRFSVKLFEIKHRDPISLNQSLRALGSSARGSMIYPNADLRTLTVRDFPENIAAIEEALKRLDVPEKSPASLEIQLHLIGASMTSSEKSGLPKNLEPVLEQLKSTLKFTHYRYVSSTLNRVSDRGKVESNGVTGSLFATPAGVNSAPENPSFYQYGLSRVSLTQDATSKDNIQIDQFKFGVTVPIKTAGGGTQYRDISIVTPLSLREGETAVVGTANIG